MNTLVAGKKAPAAKALYQKFVPVAAACVLLAVSLCLLASVITNRYVANHDFIEYWAAGRQLVHGANPYDPYRVFALERSAGRHTPLPDVMFNPPSALFLTLPLGAVPSPRIAFLLWSLFTLGAWLGSVHLLWIMNGRSKNGLHFIGYLFAPALACFLMGQMAIFVLFGLTLFLYFHRTRPWPAGAALLLCTLKPHLLLPFGAALLAWSVTRRDFRVLAGAAVALAAACVVPLCFDPSIYPQYAAMARISGVKHLLMPTLSEVLRFAVAPRSFWIQFFPAFVGCLWALWYFRRHREDWDWRRHGSLLIMASFLVTPYAWYFDAIILLPPLLYAAYRARPSALAVLFVLLAADGVQLLLRPPSSSGLHLWSSVAWLTWYLWPSFGWLTWFLWAMRHPRSLARLHAA